jgi:ketosteroid isomerase-like protein
MQTLERSWTLDAATAWARDLYEYGVDKRDAARFAAVFTDDGWLRFGNNEPLAGRANIEAAIAGFFTAMQSLRHTPERTTVAGNLLFLEATVTYLRHDGKEVSVVAMTVFEMAEMRGTPRVRRCNIYVDLAPLFSPS